MTSVVSINPATLAAFCKRNANFGRVDDAGLDHVHIFFGRGVVAAVGVLVFANLSNDDGAFASGIARDLADRLFERTPDDVHADLLLQRDILERIQRLHAAEIGRAAARDDAFFDGCLGGVQGVFDAGLLFLHFGFGRGADVDDGHAADDLRQPLLQLLAIVVGGRLVDLRLDLLHAAFDLLRIAIAFDDRGVVLVDRDALGAAEVGRA